MCRSGRTASQGHGGRVAAVNIQGFAAVTSVRHGCKNFLCLIIIMLGLHTALATLPFPPSQDATQIAALSCLP